MTLARGTRLGRYEIRGILGVGGMGEVYRAHDSRLDRDIALKVLPPEASVDPSRFRRFETEARSAAALSHPNIVAVFDIGEAEGLAYIVTELVEGGTLADETRKDPISPSALFGIVVPTADALAAAHKRGIIHRDLKPANILLTAEGVPKIADFGLAKLLLHDASPSDSRLETRTDDRTREGSILGTVAYMSPEQTRGGALDARSDQFSFGVMLYELIEGTNPFRRESAAETFAAILREEPSFSGKAWAAYPETLRLFVRRCLAKNPRDRYASTEDLARDLRAIGSGASVPGLTSHAPAASPPPRTKTATFAISAIALLLAGAAIWFVSGRRPTTVAPPPAASDQTLAILPFHSYLRNAEDASLRLGIADALISKLSGVRGLVVRPTTAVRRFASEEADAAKVSKDLGVDTVLDGSVQSAGDRLRVSAHLTRAADGRTVWSKNFDDERRNIFALQDRIAGEVLGALGVKPSADETRQLTLAYTASVAAYDLYQQARAAYLANTKPENARAVDLFGKALAIDSGYAPAHAGLAFACARYSFQYFDANPAWAARAEEEASQALAKGPFLAEAHQARAQVLASLHQNFDFRRALPEVRRALELSPNLDLSHYFLGVGYCGHLGLFEEGLAELKKTSDINPGWSAPIVSRAWLTGMLGRYDEAVQLFQKGLAMTPKYSVGREELAEVLLRQGKIHEAEAECGAALEAEPKNSWAISLRAVLAAAARRPEEVSEHLDEAVRTYEDHHVQYNAACARALSGDSEGALAALRKVLEGNFNPYPWLRIDPLLDNLRKNPGFTKLLEDSRRRYEADRDAYGSGLRRPARG
jgi:TolB-like protein/Tfp pilus assembly protein PilF